MPLNPSDYTTGFQTGRGRKIDPSKSPLAHIMFKLGWTAEAMSRATGINYDTLLRYIRGTMRINPQHLALLSEALGVDSKYLDFIPVAKPAPDYDGMVKTAYDRVMRGDNPQEVLDDFPTVGGQKPIVKSMIRLFVALEKGELVASDLASSTRGR